MAQAEITGLRVERLMTHMRVLCRNIGARPPASPQERQAAEYVRRALEDMGVGDIKEQFFASPDSLGWALVPGAALAAVLPLLRGRLGKLAGGLGLLAGVGGMIRFLMMQPPPYQPLVAQATSQNVIARIPPSGEVKRRAFLVAHLDTNRQRFMTPLLVRSLLKPFATLGIVLVSIGGIAMLVDGLLGRRKMNLWQRRAAVVGLLNLIGQVYDETQPHVEGANDNASAVAVALGIVEALRAQPLANTEVNVLFTGCEEAGCVGMEHYLRQSAPPKRESYWIDLEMVGAGRLCYVTRHGVSYLSEYRPGPRLTALAAQVARARAELGVTGKDMTIVEEVAPLVRRGHEAICIAGYDETGHLPNWHRLSDRLENIEPDTLARAAQYTYALIQAIDEN